MKLSIIDGRLYVDNLLLRNAKTLRANWSRYGGYFVPSVADSNLHKALTSAKPLTPLGIGQALTTMRNKSVFSRIVVLLLGACPSAISRLVVPIWIDAINRESIRRFTHVGNEVLKGCPSFTYSDSATSIQSKILSIWICTAGQHTPPNTVFPRSCAAMRNASDFEEIGRVASARHSSAALEVLSGNDLLSSAFASAGPSGPVFSATDIGFINNCKPAEYLTSKVNKFSTHSVTSKFITVKNAWRSAVIQIFGSYPSQASSILTPIRTGEICAC